MEFARALRRALSFGSRLGGGIAVWMLLFGGQWDLTGQQGVAPTGVPDWLDQESFDHLLGPDAQLPQQAAPVSLDVRVNSSVLDVGADYRKLLFERDLSSNEDQLREDDSSLGFLVEAIEEELRVGNESLQKHRHTLELLRRRLGREPEQEETVSGTVAISPPVSLGEATSAPLVTVPVVDPGAVLIVDPVVAIPLDEMERVALEIRESGLIKLLARLTEELAQGEKRLAFARGEKRRLEAELRVLDDASDPVRTSVVTEVATGLNYWDAHAEAWRPSQAEIEIIDGLGVARQGRHKVLFAPRISARGAVELYSEGGQRLRFNVLGLGYFDEASGKSVILAELQASEGRLVGRNQLVYEDALQGEVTADVRYTYTIGGLEQDVILKGAMPPAPETFGLDPDTTRFEVLTEMLDPPAASVSTRAIPVGPFDGSMAAAPRGEEAVDEIIDFGGLKLGYGRAFSIDGDARNVLEGRLDRASEIQVGKRFEEIGGRKILIETLPAGHLREVLPNGFQARSRPLDEPSRARVFAQRWVPDLPLALDNPGEGIQIAQGPYQAEGFVIDYVVTSSTIDLTFRAGETYLLGLVRASGHTVIEDGAVLKFQNYGGLVLELYDSGDSLTCPSSGVAYLTTEDDNTVGEVISGSTGSSSEVRTTVPMSLQVSQGSPVVRNLVIRHAINALVLNSNSTVTIESCRFEDCYRIAVLLGWRNARGSHITACNVDTVSKSFWGSRLSLVTPLIEDCATATVTSRPNLTHTQYSYGLHGILPTIASSQARIHYTTDGSLPTLLSPVMPAAVEQRFSQTTLVRARGFELGKRPSRVASKMIVDSRLWGRGLGEAVDLGELEFTTQGYDSRPWDNENHLLWTPQFSLDDVSGK